MFCQLRLGISNLLQARHCGARLMSQKSFLDVSPPPYRGPRDKLDRDSFRKAISVLGVRTPAAKTGSLMKSEALRRWIMDLPRIRSVVSDPKDPNGDRLLLLRVTKEDDIAPEALDYLKKESIGLENHTLELDYDYWTADDILQALLPEELRDGSPSGFAITGHIAHLNLNAEYLPYKYIIGQIILDKNKRIRTVVNKLDSIDHQFRFFKMELLAGEPEYIVEHHESDCRFTFDFTQVYWNSRLHTEHERLVKLFSPQDVVADVFAGVGPFAVPAAVKGCAVLANDLNPNSAKYLTKNVQDNRVTGLVRVFCEDGRDFIKQAVSRCWNEPFPAFSGPRLSRTQERAQKKPKTGAGIDTNDVAPRRKISHFVMNLPDSAITFLDAFRGIFADIPANPGSAYDDMPMIHCHCFTRELEPEKAEFDIRKRVEERLGGSLTEEVSLHFVRSVAPNKNMYCISFRLPRAVGFSGPAGTE